MSEAAQPAADAPLSVDAAVGLLDTAPEQVEREETEPEADDTPSDAEPTAEDEIDPEEAIELDPEETDDPATPAIAAPQSWDAAERALFATLTPEAQQVIAARDAETSKAVSQAQQKAADAAKKAETDNASVTQLRAATEAALNRVAETIKGKWDNIDWVAWAQSDPAAYTAGKAQYEAEQASLAQIASAHQAQRTAELQAFQATKMERIKTEAPALVDPAKGPARVAALESCLEKKRIPRDIFHTLDAFTIGLAYDGMTLRELRAKAKAKPTPAPPRAAVRPAAAQAVRSPQRAAQEATNRFVQTKSIDDAVAVLNSRT